VKAGVDAILKAAGIDVPPRQVEVLRDGFPSFVLRVTSPRAPGVPSLILKACPVGSREPRVMERLSHILRSVPAVLGIACGESFDVILMEDLGARLLCDPPEVESYMRAVREIARIHRRFQVPADDDELAALVPAYDLAKWASVVRAAALGTLSRLADGTYPEAAFGGASGLRALVGELADRSLSLALTAREGAADAPALGQTLVHGDFHEGNVLLRAGERERSGRGGLGIVDWGDCRWDSGLFDLVSLVDVARRSGSLDLDEADILRWYLEERLGRAKPGCLDVSARAWHACYVLRAWDELRWFSLTGDDYADRAARELGAIRTHLDAME
jgi:hypothetical protein